METSTTLETTIENTNTRTTTPMDGELGETTVDNTTTTSTKTLTDSNEEDNEFVNTQKPPSGDDVNNNDNNSNMDVENNVDNSNGKETTTTTTTSNENSENNNKEDEEDDLFGDKSMNLDEVTEEQGDDNDIETEFQSFSKKKKSKKSKKTSKSAAISDDSNIDDLFDKPEEQQEGESSGKTKRLRKKLKRTTTEGDVNMNEEGEDKPQENTEEGNKEEGEEQVEEEEHEQEEEEEGEQEDYSEGEEKKKRKRSKKEKKSKKSKKSSKNNEDGEFEVEGDDNNNNTQREKKKPSPLEEFEKKKKIKKNIDDKEAFKYARIIVDKMKHAAKQDSQSLKFGQPAVQKLILLPEVDSLLHKKDLYNSLVDEDIYTVVSSWLTPSPNIKIKLVLLKILANIPVDTSKIVSSGILEQVRNIRKNEKETPDVRQLAYQVVDRWTRPIVNNDSSSRRTVKVDLKMVHNQSATVGIETDGSLQKKKSIYLPSHIKHATGCEKVKLDYKVRPESILSDPINSPYRNIHKIDKEIDKIRQTTTTKGSPRAATISIEGKGMNF